MTQTRVGIALSGLLILSGITGCAIRSNDIPVTSALSSSVGLGDADINNSSNQTYSAKCGQKANECSVSFKDGKLMVNESGGITSDQFVSVVTARTCRQTSLIMPWIKSCYPSQYDYDYTITYFGKDGNKKSALIVFRPGYLLQGEETYLSFNRDLQIWIEDVLRPIGSTIKIQ